MGSVSSKTSGAQEQPSCYPVTETILGINEEALVQTGKERIERFVRDGCFVNEKTGTLTSFGSFDTPTVESMAAQVAQLPVEGNSKKKAPVLTTRSGVDIGSLQGTLSTEDRAMIQVASNFNCLENPGRGTKLDSGRFVDGAFLDCTQGPAAVFGTTSAYLYRCHFARGGQSLVNGQEELVNLLQHTGEYFGVPQNGKLTLTGVETLLRSEEDVTAAATKVCIGLHKDCPVLFGRTSKTIVYKEPLVVVQNSKDQLLEYPVVDHVLSASLNAWNFGVDRHLSNATLNNIMRSLLRAAYEGIYMAAILRQRKRLYLTLVGGGSFGNPIPLIVSEILRAHEKWANHPACQLEECVICLYSERDEESVMDAMAKANSNN
ncbi:expressed unknown protein [Seminavis robusta]|uniref:Uncharacterized protein n=1 Tax=Seminavis robusta TaxID=568900 RepID=A0A9N8EAU8_9STRA|nr:expressed unknown protein [Seminavis robusta]|eukprot:Sro698_g189240.1 n/a (376) ;mRNA; f:30297-31424